ncbi:copper resistance protein CopC [Georgenia sp. AZ-5]|uniref:copper resistance CopC family protein n=1 Tax=Georgenia sp. AZ-5 TaxID=3367526 RepID=UPI003755080F
MTAHPAPRTVHVLAALLALLGVLGLVGTVTAPPARAHDTLIGSTPAAEATVEPPSEIVLTFNNELLDTGTQVRVTDASGAVVAEGPATVEGPDATFTLPAPLGDGGYGVTWRVVSSDGHPIEGQYAFTVAGASATQAPATTSAPEETPDAVTTQGPVAEGGEEAGRSRLPAWVLIVLAVGVLGGVVALAIRNWPRNR